MTGREGGNRFNRGDGGGEGRFGRGGGRFGHGGGRDRGGGGGGRNMVWMRDNDDGGSSNVDPRHGSSDKARWDAAAMEQGGTRGSEKWGDNSNNTVAGGAAGGRQELRQGAPQAQDRRHPTLGKSNISPLVGGAQKECWVFFYDFFFSVDKILVKNPPKEKVNVQMETDGGIPQKEPGLLRIIAQRGKMLLHLLWGSLRLPLACLGGGTMKNMSLDPVQENDESEQNHQNSDEMQSEEDSEEVDDMLLTDTMAAEAEKSQMRESEKGPTKGTSYDKIVVNPLQIIPSPVINRKFSSYLDACVGEPSVTEMEHDENSCQKKDQPYFVQSPVQSSEPVDVIPTPPALEEVQVRFGKRTAGVNMEHVGLIAVLGGDFPFLVSGGFG
ncbi:hypothetical protein D1007_08123 [Hordeum vulgare]|nr:hypothetical protein D1007_08123 [Hordeum vulgare]